jgi:hypothetical protein
MTAWLPLVVEGGRVDGRPVPMREAWSRGAIRSPPPVVGQADKI